MALASFTQRILLLVTYYLCRVFVTKKNTLDWVLGVEDIASMIYLLGKALPNAKTVCFNNNRFYQYKYDYELPIKTGFLARVIKAVYGPILLGYLANKSKNFWYIWTTGFLIERQVEMAFLKSIDKKIVCHFGGDDIRSPRLMKAFCAEKGLDTFIDYFGAGHPFYLSDSYEAEKMKAAEIADTYADVVFSAEFEQISHLKSKQYYNPFLYDPAKFNFNPEKFTDLSRIKIVHAPSNPLVKGTPLVRAAIKKLQMEGYQFDYVELINVSNAQVLEHLRSAHIVMNQFYQLIPSVFGIEAMANHCAVLQSASMHLEPNQPQGDEYSWLETSYWQVYDNLKFLLDNPAEIERYANGGYEYVANNLAFDIVAKRVKRVLNENGFE
ncbi:hypothetical protein PALB_11560 [Pseudoalteromonas luteoviolacea B = ATCC 29581]|nr:hypothetical protein PALB_11560 [Pseudoalteromonas luteoviolacea B = ATCC 29581]